jgi:predicted heme/steroid binding protein/uncharacterized membrane protein
LPKKREFPPKELAAARGADGQPRYIAYEGQVYDVSASPLWAGGEHMASHRAGADLTAELADAPHGPEVLERITRVGVLQAAAEDVSELDRPGGKLERLLKKFPLLRRHPHPMVVHFPIVFMISASVFTIIYVVSGVESFEVTGFYCLGGGVLFTVPAMLTGLFTWWLNYQARWLKPVVIKLVLSPILLLVGAAAFVWRWQDPGVLAVLGGIGILYFVLILLLTPLVSVIGWYGANLTFPLHEEVKGG